MARVDAAKARVRKDRTKAEGTRTEAFDLASRVAAPSKTSFLKGCLFGPPKTGKTTAATNTEGKVLLVETEPEGEITLAGRTNVDVFKPEHWRDLNDVTSSLRGSDHGYDTVVYDSVTFMFELVGNKDVAEAFRKNTDVRRPYGKSGAAINQIVYNAVMLPMNVIFTAQLKLDEPDEDAGETPLNPNEGEFPVTLAVTPMIYKVLTPAVSFMGRTYKTKGNIKDGVLVPEYWVSFEDYGRSPAGDRLGLPDKIQDLNLDTLLATTEGE